MAQPPAYANMDLHQGLTQSFNIPIVPDNSVYVATGYAYTLHNGDSLIVNQGIGVASADKLFGAVVADDGSNFIACDGAIIGHFGIELEGRASGVSVGATGLVSGSYFGIALYDGSDSLVNRGTIFGGDYGVILAPSLGSQTTLTNTGSILAGLSNHYYDFNAAIDIKGLGTTRIDNSGLIKTALPDSFAIKSEYASADTVINSGTIIGNVMLGDGNDVFDTHKGKVSGTIDGGAGADKITGSAFADTMTGGADNDTFLFRTKADAHAVDHITDFAHGHDKLALSKALFKLDAHETLQTGFHDITVGLSHEQADDHILYNHDTGALFYDADGKGGHAPIHFATLDSHPTLNYVDFLLV